ncbi:MAG: ASCH domain-containing protein [Chloroflexi bacterium]|nr:ASCH domain-containing protein [Chloroflexota bacterium]
MSELDSVRAMWKAYLRAIGEAPATTKKSYTAWHFCDNEQDANALAELVKQGVKRATAGACWSYKYEEQPLPTVGDYSVITDWSGNAVCIICTTALEVVPFNEVTTDFAKTEGEGDGSLAYWRKVHWDFFTRELRAFGRKPEKTMPVLCERFEVVYPQEYR